MKCLICGGDSAGEVCNKCSRLEKILYQKEWSHREGMLIKKVEDFRVAISNMRISGKVVICDNPKGLNARTDNISHFILNIKECEQTMFQNKKTLMVVIENSTGENSKYTRYCYLPGFEQEDQFVAAVTEGKQKAASLAEKIRQTNGLASTSSTSSSSYPSAEAIAATRTVAPAPAPVAPTPVAPAPAPAAPSYDTVALSSIATDINEFETKIKKLKVLRDNGILSEEEYLAEKKKLVSIF